MWLIYSLHKINQIICVSLQIQHSINIPGRWSWFMHCRASSSTFCETCLATVHVDLCMFMFHVARVKKMLSVTYATSVAQGITLKTYLCMYVFHSNLMNHLLIKGHDLIPFHSATKILCAPKFSTSTFTGKHSAWRKKKNHDIPTKTKPKHLKHHVIGNFCRSQISLPQCYWGANGNYYKSD